MICEPTSGFAGLGSSAVPGLHLQRAVLPSSLQADLPNMPHATNTDVCSTAGQFLLSTVAYVAWVASLAACFALWTLAPKLTSLQRQIAADQPCDGGLVHMHALLQSSRRMQHLPAAIAPGSQTADLAAVQPVGPLPVAPGHSITPAAHKPTEQQPTSQQQQLQRPSASQTAVLDPAHGLPADLVEQIGPVDVVYLWVNGSDPLTAQELQDLHDHPPTPHAGSVSEASQGSNSSSLPTPEEDPARRSRFDAGCDELRYSLRSLELYMPWFRHVYIVTNGQVGCLNLYQSL
jgi:hypothetical protein